jgi:hypothetical protein
MKGSLGSLFFKGDVQMKILISMMLYSISQLAFAGPVDLCPGGAKVVGVVENQMARYVKCDDGKIYALTGGGINGSKLAPEYTSVELSWEQIEKSGVKIKLSGEASQESLFGNAFPVVEGGVQVEVRPSGGGTTTTIGGTNSCVVTCTEKYDGKSASQVKRRKECIESCTQNVNPKQRKIADGFLATCELGDMLSFISCPDNSVYLRQMMSINTAIMIGINSENKKDEPSFLGGGGIGFSGGGGIGFGGGYYQPSKKFLNCAQKCSMKSNAKSEETSSIVADSCLNKCQQKEFEENSKNIKKAFENYLEQCDMSIDFQLITCDDGALFKKSSITKDEAIRKGLKTPFGYQGGFGGGSIGGGGTNGSVGF